MTNYRPGKSSLVKKYKIVISTVIDKTKHNKSPPYFEVMKVRHTYSILFLFKRQFLFKKSIVLIVHATFIHDYYSFYLFNTYLQGQSGL